MDLLTHQDLQQFAERALQSTDGSAHHSLIGDDEMDWRIASVHLSLSLYYEATAGLTVNSLTFDSSDESASAAQAAFDSLFKLFFGAPAAV